MPTSVGRCGLGVKNPARDIERNRSDWLLGIASLFFFLVVLE